MSQQIAIGLLRDSESRCSAELPAAIDQFIVCRVVDTPPPIAELAGYLAELRPLPR